MSVETKPAAVALVALAVTMAVSSVASPAFADSGQVVGWGSYTAAPGGLTNVVEVDGGYLHAVALKNDGTLSAWGDNTNGQLDVPEALADVTAISVGTVHSLALRSAGTVVAWGSNDYGQTDVPAGLRDVVAVAAGARHSVALKTDGTVVAWGDNSSGQIDVPADLSDVAQIDATPAGYHTVARKNDGTVVAWGSNSNGQSTVPEALTSVADITAGGAHSAALLSNGSITVWGSDIYGQHTVPGDVGTVADIESGAHFILARRTDGTVKAWGQNASGQTTVPGGLNGVVRVSGGSFASYAVTGVAASTAPTAGTASLVGVARPGRTVSVANPEVTGAPYPRLLWQWQTKDGGAWSDIEGATGSRYAVPDSLGGQKLRIRVTAANSAGSATSITRVRKVGRALNTTKSGKPAGGGCTTRGTVADDTINVTVPANRTAIVCVYRGSDTVSLNGVGANSRVVLVKGAGSLEVVWNAGASQHGGTVGAGALTVVRPDSATITASQGGNPNTDTDGATALCLTNKAFADATDLTALEAAITGTIDWFQDENGTHAETSC